MRVGLPGRVCHNFWAWLAGLVMGDVYSEGPLKKYVDDYYCMQSSNDNDFADPMGLSSLGAVDLDTSIVPNIFGLQAFDCREPISRMLPGQFSNELRVLVPDAAATLVNFHDIVLEDLHATPALLARQITPGDVTSLRRRWPTALFTTMHKRQADMERLHRACRQCFEGAFSSGRSGICPQCNDYVVSALDRHMMNKHLELGQLWRCPVEWCAVWKGSVGDCLDHLRGKHDGAKFLALKNLGKFFLPWTVTHDFWHAAFRPAVSGMVVDIKLFHDSGCRLVHRYRIYGDPLPHPALRKGVLKKLLGFVHRTMATAQLTHLHLTVPSSGMTTGPVPLECFAVVPLSRASPVSRRVSFPREVDVIESSPLLFSPGEGSLI